MKYVSYDLDTKLQTANMNYLTENKKYYYMYVSKKQLIHRWIEIYGKITNQHLLSVEYLDKGVKVEQIQEDSGRSLYKADFYYNDVYYLFMGEMEKSSLMK